MITERIARAQAALATAGLDAWLFAGGTAPDPALEAVFRIAGLPHATRRYAYFVPVHGDPVRVLHAIEPRVLDALPGITWIYNGRDQWREAMRAMVQGHERIAMQYSPEGGLPAVDALPAGWLELLRACGAQPSSSAPVLAELAVLSATELAGHERAAAALTRAVQDTFARVTDQARRDLTLTELEVQALLVDRVKAAGLVTDHPPIVAFGEHTADPHYAPAAGTDAPLHRQELVLVDVWARESAAGSIFADLTWMAVLEEEVPHEYEMMFALLCRARDHGFEAVDRAARDGRPLTGAHVDQIVRGLLAAEGYGDYFRHRTGHSLDTSVHGTGVNLDGLETVDDRTLLTGSLFTIEPGVYLPGRFGMRTEIDVVLEAGSARITTQPFQRSIVPLLK